MSYYNSADVYRHQQEIPEPNGLFQSNSGINPWYTGYHLNQNQQISAALPASCYVQGEQQIWHHHATHSQGGFQPDFLQNFIHTGIPALQQPQHEVVPECQIPSPPITASGSDNMSSPGAQSENISLQQNTIPPPTKSPYDSMKKTSYQTEPDPITENTRTKDKYRVVYTDHQRVTLEKEFYCTRYITIKRKAELAVNLGLSERQVKIWFQNRRAKERKQGKKRALQSNNAMRPVVNYLMCCDYEDKEIG